MIVQRETVDKTFQKKYKLKYIQSRSKYEKCNKIYFNSNYFSYNIYTENKEVQDFLVEQAKIYDSHIINNIDINETIDLMVNNILEKFVGVNDEQES